MGIVKGLRVELTAPMKDDPRPIEVGTKGTVEKVDGIGTIHILWDNGRQLGLVENVDEYKIINDGIN